MREGKEREEREGGEMEEGHATHRHKNKLDGEGGGEPWEGRQVCVCV